MDFNAETLIKELAVDFPQAVNITPRLISGAEETVEWKPGEVRYSALPLLGRGVGNLLSGIAPGRETRAFAHFSVSIDISRNGVHRLEVLKRWFRRLALLGFNRIYLYAEDMYRLPGEPAFGALRGACTAEEIRELDECAARLGMELCGCIQTFGHLGKVLKWKHFYRNITDVPEVLLADDANALELVGKMLDFWSEALRSRTINIGMDETHLLGAGRYYELHGPTDRFDIFTRHLERVSAMCGERGLSPEIWSDMFFRIASPDGDYYNPETEIPPEISAKIPANVSLVYWDYYHEDREFYRSFIGKHLRATGKLPVLASCVRGVRTLWYDRVLTEATLPPAVEAGREAGISEFMITTWGDDGCYCDPESIWAGLCGAADMVYGADSMLGEGSARRCETIAGLKFACALAAGRLELHLEKSGKLFRCLSGLLLWDDPLLGLAYGGYAAQIEDFGRRAAAHYREIAAALAPHGGHGALLAETLMRKVEFRRRLLAAYPHDRMELEYLSRAALPELITYCERLSESFRNNWLAVYKPFGLETLQIRQGGQLARLRETKRVLDDFLAGAIAEIAELAAQPPGGLPNTPLFYSDIAASGNL